MGLVTGRRWWPRSPVCMSPVCISGASPACSRETVPADRQWPDKPVAGLLNG